MRDYRGQLFWDVAYTPAGDIKEIIDDLKGITYTYTYDKLHRLISETNTGDYNPAENPEKNRYTYIYSNNHINAVNQISLNGTDYYYTYDDNGNMNSGPDFTDPMQIASRVMEFNADNMPIRIEHAIGEDVLSTCIIYNGDGVRAKKTIYEVIQLKKKIKVREWSTTYYVGKHFEVINGEPVRYIFAGNLRIAKVTDSATHYFHKDHLNSSVAMTDENGTAVETSEYMPFGHERNHTGKDVTDYKFTDQELDTETGLYNYDARLYDPVIGRFISPDSIVPDLYDPQSLNSYSYCRNNPLIYTDPSGHEPLNMVEAYDILHGRKHHHYYSSPQWQQDLGEFNRKAVPVMAVVVIGFVVGPTALTKGLIDGLGGTTATTKIGMAITAIEICTGFFSGLYDSMKNFVGGLSDDEGGSGNNTGYDAGDWGGMSKGEHDSFNM